MLRNSEFLIHVSVPNVSSFLIQVLDLKGRKIQEHIIYEASYAKLNAPITQGLYLVEITYTNYLGEPVKEKLKISVY